MSTNNGEHVYIFAEPPKGNGQLTSSHITVEKKLSEDINSKYLHS